VAAGEPLNDPRQVHKKTGVAVAVEGRGGRHLPPERNVLVAPALSFQKCRAGAGRRLYTDETGPRNPPPSRRGEVRGPGFLGQRENLTRRACWAQGR
jgi:hypothetical protein